MAVLNSTAWWRRHWCESNLSRVATGSPLSRLESATVRSLYRKTIMSHICNVTVSNSVRSGERMTLANPERCKGVKLRVCLGLFDFAVAITDSYKTVSTETHHRSSRPDKAQPRSNAMAFKASRGSSRRSQGRLVKISGRAQKILLCFSYQALHWSL